MQYYHDFESIHLTNTVVACGKFDGIHKGHQKLIEKLLQYEKQGYESAIFTFDSSIAKVMKNGEEFLFTAEERRYYLEQLGIQHLAEYRFEEPLIHLSPEAFVRDILVGQMGAKVIVVGEEFHFGYQRQGDCEVLRCLSKKYDYQLVVVPRYKEEENEEKISSSEIRICLSKGQMEQTNEMLGHPYFIRGEVVHGRQLGRTIGMPTANLQVPTEKLIPPNGVYVTRCRLQERILYGITNIGTKPTVDGRDVGVETYLFSFDEDIYGEEITVEFLHYVRKEQKFDSVAQLIEQMHRDAEFGMQYVKDLIS